MDNKLEKCRRKQMWPTNFGYDPGKNAEGQLASRMTFKLGNS